MQLSVESRCSDKNYLFSAQIAGDSTLIYTAQWQGRQLQRPEIENISLLHPQRHPSSFIPFFTLSPIHNHSLFMCSTSCHQCFFCPTSGLLLWRVLLMGCRLEEDPATFQRWRRPLWSGQKGIFWHKKINLQWPAIRMLSHIHACFQSPVY